MSKGKNHNSILFLTTIGVYLGLVLVGGTAPQVFAHSATTRNFEFSEEIEVKDDLDTKPDSEAALEQFASALIDIYRIAAEISANDPEGVENGRYNYHRILTVSRHGGGFGYEPTSDSPGLQTESGRYWLPQRSLHDAFLPRTEKKQHNFRIDFVLAPGDISFQAAVTYNSPETADASSKAFFDAFTDRKELESIVLKRLIYTSTEVSVNNDQLVVVTRLPRGSLDPLLATNAK